MRFYQAVCDVKSRNLTAISNRCDCDLTIWASKFSKDAFQSGAFVRPFTSTGGKHRLKCLERVLSWPYARLPSRNGRSRRSRSEM